jgi:uroporphyrinogen decarboxylase
VEERIEILAPGGGFVFCQVHNILPNVPPENIVAMYRAVNPLRGIPRTSSRGRPRQPLDDCGGSSQRDPPAVSPWSFST